MARRIASRSRPGLIAVVSFALLAGGCSVSPAPPGPTGIPGAPASPTTGPSGTPAGDPDGLTASPAASERGGQVRWYRVPAPFGDPATATRIDAVVEWQSRLVGFGRVKTPGRNQFNELAAVFLSDTGQTWRTVPIDVGVGPEDGSEISLLAAGPQGMVVFGGTCCAVEEPAIWYSSDGGAWERVALEASMFDGAQLAAARATDDGFVVVGSQSGRAAIWTSNDGRAWTAVSAADAGLGTGAIGDVVRADGRWLAAGYQDTGDTYDGALWESIDGVQWQRLPTQRLFLGELDTTFGRLYPTPGGVLLIGNEGPHDEREGCERLLGQTASVAFVALPDTALSCGWGMETHWWSSDGRAWVRLPSLLPLPGEPPLTGPGLIEFRLITAGGPGLLNLGEDRLGGVRLWTSTDGREWQDEGAMGLRLNQDLPSGVAVLNGSIIAVGNAWDGSASNPGEPAVWIGQGL